MKRIVLTLTLVAVFAFASVATTFADGGHGLNLTDDDLDQSGMAIEKVEISYENIVRVMAR